MSTKRESVLGPAFETLSRRHVLGGLGAIAATACGAAEPAASGAGGGAGAGGSGAGNGAGSGSLAGGGAGGGAAGAGAGGPNAAGAEAAGTGSGGAAAGAAGSNAAGAGGMGGGLMAPTFDDVPMCVASKTDAAGQGPFFIHELEKDDDISLYRQDIRGRYNEAAEAGVEMQLHLRILDATSTSCNQVPVPDVDVYIWHTDAQGFYSGFGTRGGADEQKPDTPYKGTPNSGNLENTDRFCRGIQTSDANGVVSFRSIFPGWYNGRDLHIHFVAFKKGSMSAGRVDYSAANSGGKWLFTTQFYFEPSFSKSIHEKNAPYLARTTLPAYAGAMAADEPNNSGLRAKSSLMGDSAGVGGVVVAQMQILLDPKA